MTQSAMYLMGAYSALLFLLSIFALQRLFLAVSAWRWMRDLPPAKLLENPDQRVLVQVPLYNEPEVAERVIRAVCELDYPRDLLTIQILDDSSDETVGIVARAVARFQARGIQVEQVRRPTREGFKAGALAYGMTLDDAPLIAIFDADFIPQPSFLRHLVGDFKNEQVGAVQARWGHLNRDDSILTRAQGFLLDGHFLNEHAGRFARGCFFNFNGTAGIWRRACIEDAGGWSGRTITEDLDLSYRAQLKSWRLVFRPEVVVPAELPDHGEAFKVQQHRWAKGSIETARLLLGPIWKTPGLRFLERLEASFHLLGNFAYPLVIVLGLLMPWVMVVRFSSEPGVMHLVDSLLFLSSTGLFIVTYWGAGRRAGLSLGSMLWVPSALAMGVGLAFNNTRALIEALSGHRTAFIRTPKQGTATRMSLGRLSGVSLGQSVVEIIFGLYSLTGLWPAIEYGRYLALPLIGLFGGGFLILGLGSLYTGLRPVTVRLESENLEGARLS